MSKSTQGYTLFNMLKAAGDKGVTKAEVAEKLGVKEGSVPIYFFGLRKFFKVEVESIKNGRAIVAYKLVNPDVVEVPQFRKDSKNYNKKKTSTSSVKAINKITKSVVSDDGEVPTLDKDLDLSGISDREFNDIKAHLGLD